MARKPFRIGWNEWCALPQLGIPAIKAKIDTGAKTSAIHAADIQPFTREGQRWVRFVLDPLPKKKRLKIACEAPLHDYRTVTSSTGHRQKRYVIRTRLVIGAKNGGAKSWDIELTLASRDTMSFRMLLGREALVSGVLVNPRKSRLLGKLSTTELQRLYSAS